MSEPTSKDWHAAVAKRNDARRTFKETKKEAKSLFEKAALAKQQLKLTEERVQNDAFDVPE